MLEDELLKWKFRRGRQEALSRIYEKYFDSMLTLAMGLPRHAEDAQNVVHDVFVSFAGSVDHFGLQDRLSGYLATGVVNRVRDRRRRHQRRAEPPTAAPASRSEQAGPAQAVIHSEEAHRINGALATLPYEQREVIAGRQQSLRQASYVDPVCGRQVRLTGSSSPIRPGRRGGKRTYQRNTLREAIQRLKPTRNNCRASKRPSS